MAVRRGCGWIVWFVVLGCSGGLDVGQLPPPDERPENSTVLIPDAAPPDGPAEQGDGTLLVITPTKHAFPRTPIGGAGALAAFVVENRGAKETGELAPTLVGPNADVFSLLGGGCVGKVAPFGKCVQQVKFEPRTAGDKIAQLIIAPGVEAALSATVPPADTLTITPPTAPLGPTLVGAPSAPTKLAVRNLGNNTTGKLAVAIPEPSFRLAPGGSTCDGLVLAAGGSCTLEIVYLPLTAENRTGSVIVTSDNGGRAVANLLGQTRTMTAPPILVLPTIRLGSNCVSSAIWEVLNPGPSDTGALTTAVIGSQDFTVGRNCPTVGAMGGCRASVFFRPMDPGEKRAELRASAWPGGETRTIVSATASATAVNITPLARVFSPGAGAEGTFTITNGDAVASPMLAMKIDAGVVLGITADTCTGTSLAACTGTCSVTVRLLSPGMTINGTLIVGGAGTQTVSAKVTAVP